MLFDIQEHVNRFKSYARKDFLVKKLEEGTKHFPGKVRYIAVQNDKGRWIGVVLSEQKNMQQYINLAMTLENITVW